MNDFKCHKCEKILKCDCEADGPANPVDEMVRSQPVSEKPLFEMLLECADKVDSGTGILLRSAAFRIAAIESAATRVVEAAETRDLKGLERGITGFKILGF